MTVIKVKGFKIYQSNGKQYCYHRATGKPIDLEKHPLGSASFLAQVARIGDIVAKHDTPKPGTLGLMIEAYRKHPDYLTKAKRTRQDYLRCMDYLQPLAGEQLIVFDPPGIVKIRDKARAALGLKWGNYVLAFMSLLFSFGLEHGLVSENPCRGIRKVKKPKNQPRANRPWADSERHMVMDVVPSCLNLPFALMMYCGCDPVDVRTMPKTAIRNGMLNVNREKTGVPLWKPLPKPAFEAWEAAPDHGAITLCATSRGKPWTKSGLESSWRKVKLDLEANGLVGLGLTMKGLRHTVGTILAEMGLTHSDIADYLGHKTLAMAQHYTDRADKTKRLGDMVVRLDAELVRRGTK